MPLTGALNAGVGLAGLINIGLAGLAAGGGGGTPAPVEAYDLPYPTDVRLESSLLAPEVDGNDQVTTWPDMMGLADAVRITGGTLPPGGAPKVVTDHAGRTGVLFEGQHALEVQDTLANYSGNNCTVYAVIRYLDAASSTAQSVFGIGRNASGTAPNTLRAFMNHLGSFQASGVAANSQPPFLAHGSKYLVNGDKVLGNERVAGQSRRKMILHAGIQVVAIAGGSSSTAEIHMNDEYCTGITTMNTGTATTSGGEIGRHAYDPRSSTYGTFILYGLFIQRSKQTTAQIQANIGAMMDAYGVVPIEHQLILDGDSRFADSGPSIMGESKQGYLGPQINYELERQGIRNWRVINHAIGGSTIDADDGGTGQAIDKGLRQKRDYLNNSMFSGNWTLPGRNVVAVEIWHNDSSQTLNAKYTAPVYGAARADQIYANLIDLVRNDTRSYLALGYEYMAGISLPGSTTMDAGLQQMRGHLRAASFFEDFGGQPGGPYEGKVRRAENPLSMQVTGAWGDYVLDPALSSTDPRLNSQGGIYYADQAHQRAVCQPFMAKCMVDRLLGADPYV